MYSALLHTHNLLRWLVLVVGVLAIVSAVRGLAGNRPYAATRRYTAMFMGSLHLQLLLGLLLVLVSPIVKAAMRDMPATMRIPELRFFIAEHPVVMVLAAVLMTVGSIVAKNANTDMARHRRAMLFTTVTMALVLWGIPWKLRALFPGM